MLYPKSKSSIIDPALFKKPTSEYRGAPFWSWNCKLEKEILLEQVMMFKEMGFGGFHIHVRTGLETPYLGDEYMEAVKLCDNKAIEEKMLCWLYDEDRYPSGSAGGAVTRDLHYRARYMVISQGEHNEFETSKAAFDQLVRDGGKPNGYYLASYTVVLDEKGCLKEYRRVDRSTACTKDGGLPENIWHAFIRLSEESPWYNDQTYVDVLNKSAIEKFIEVTHERYYGVLDQEFGKSVPAIFTDEPQVSRKSTMPFARSVKDVTMSFTDDLPDTYRAEYGEELLDCLPEILWELPNGKVSITRYRYHNHLGERFVSAFSDTLGNWCGNHNIALTGHFMSERTLYSQALALGEAMRCYRSFQLPGIDNLCDAREISTAKQAASVAHQYGREGVLSELYGSTHWYFDFKGHKLQGDWQAALGITIRVPHLFFMSMEGESKRDWPASIGYQSPWYKEYPYVEDHFARVNTALTRGRCDIRVGVIHPIESFWLAWGPNDQTGALREQMDNNFENFISWMLYGLIDFDFISESLLPEICSEGTNPLKVGQMSYDTIIVPDCRTLRRTTLDRLESFRQAGGRIIFMGSIPTHVDAAPSDIVKDIACKCEQIPFNRYALLSALESERFVEVRQTNGKISENLFHQLREDNGSKWLFVCHVNRKKNLLDKPESYRIRIKGIYNPTLYDTITGEITSCPAEIIGTDTVIIRDMYAEDSLLLHLEKDIPSAAPVKAAPPKKQALKLHGPVDFSLSEPNVLLLDRAEYSFNGGELYPAEEILRIDNKFRDILGYPHRMDHITQPYAIVNAEPPENLLTLCYTIMSDITVTGARLAVERPENAVITLNGQIVAAEPDSYYTDKAIKAIPLPELVKGVNKLIIKLPFGRKTNVEWCYILGDFGVRVSGAYSCIVKAPAKLAFGDWVSQGLPFYSGNLTYKCTVTAENDVKDAVLEIPHFSTPVIAISLDGQRKGLIAYAPHRLSLGDLSAGSHLLEITAYGNRYNSFGSLHNANDEFMWYGPDSYRTTGSQWTDTYLLRPMGVLSNPIIYKGE